jgi:hypothetical protein
MSTKRIRSELARALCLYWAEKLGMGFHPDTRGKDYWPYLSAKEIAEYDRDMERLFSLAGDPYAHGVEAFKELGLI